MTWQDIETLNAGSTMIARAPGGYWVRVMVVDKWRERVKVHDSHSPCHRYWVGFKTLEKSWRRGGG